MRVPASPIYPKLCRFQIAILSLAAMTVLCLSTARADTGPYVLEGRVVVAEPHFGDSFDVLLLLDGVREVGRVQVTSMSQFRFTRLAHGTYVLMLNIPGFREVRQTVLVGRLQINLYTNVFVERQPVAVPVRSGSSIVREYDSDDVIAAADVGKYSVDLSDDLRTAHQELLRNDFEGALRRLDRILDQFPDYYPARRDRGVVYQKLGRYGDARSEYEKARDINPSSPVPLIYLAGLFLVQAEQVAEQTKRVLIGNARDDLQKAIAIWPQGCFPHYLLGVTYYEAELYEDAEDSFLRALTLDPQFAETHLGLSNLYIKIQEWDRALFHLEAFLVDRPNREDADILRNVRLRIQNIIEKEEGRF